MPTIFVLRKKSTFRFRFSGNMKNVKKIRGSILKELDLRVCTKNYDYFFFCLNVPIEREGNEKSQGIVGCNPTFIISNLTSNFFLQVIYIYFINIVYMYVQLCWLGAKTAAAVVVMYGDWRLQFFSPPVGVHIFIVWAFVVITIN